VPEPVLYVPDNTNVIFLFELRPMFFFLQKEPKKGLYSISFQKETEPKENSTLTKPSPTSGKA
jgi:hypothetical protein